MIIRCEGCAATYFLPDAKVPAKPTRVRCPQCRAVFTLAARSENVVAAAEEAVVRSPAKSAAREDKARKRSEEAAEARTGRGKPKWDADVSTQEAGSERGESRSEGRKSRGKGGDGDQEARARRLARVLVSDILCYNQEKRDRALVDGTLMTVLGDEIKKSWELYKEKVGPELAKSTNYFKEALNEILADGQKVF
jgi:predicted Zn finger-like uncharacterized protein